MRITCFIDSLGAGGAQRQLVSLGIGLAGRGHTVSFVTYHQSDFFLPVLKQHGIQNFLVRPKKKWQRLFLVRQALNDSKPDVVLAFMSGTCIYAEVARMLGGRWGLVVSERALPYLKSFSGRSQRLLHRAADCVVTNCHTARLLLADAHPWLAKRLVTIYNIVDPELFKPVETVPPKQGGGIRLLGLGNYTRNKNQFRVVEALALLKQRNPSVEISYHNCGGFPVLPDGRNDETEWKKAQELIRAGGLEKQVCLEGSRNDVRELYASCDAVIVPSLHEGLPNVVCEAMIVGKPVLTSNVSDAGNLVEDNVNGFVFDPASVESIADAIAAFAQSDSDRRVAMGRVGRERALKYFSPATVLDHYETILTAAANHSGIPLEHWVPAVPASAERTFREMTQ